jgi:hypothetical protein
MMLILDNNWNFSRYSVPCHPAAKINASFSIYSIENTSIDLPLAQGYLRGK